MYIGITLDCGVETWSQFSLIVNPSSRGHAPLPLAVSIYPPLCVFQLHVCDPFGMASFHWAAQMGATKSFKLLMSRGADKTAKDINGRSVCILSWSTRLIWCFSFLVVVDNVHFALTFLSLLRIRMYTHNTLAYPGHL